MNSSWTSAPAEGYYAVGMAVRCQGTQVLAFELDPKGQEALRRSAELNGVQSSLTVRRCCDVAELAAALGDRRLLIICDCEGEERNLLDPGALPALAQAAILVEVHDFVVPGLANELEARFRATHAIERIWQTSRDEGEYPYSDWYSKLLLCRYFTWVVNECRPERMCWLWMTPRN